jgi:hypothetical protein
MSTQLESLLGILIPESDGHPSAAQAISIPNLITDVSKQYDYALIEKMLNSIPEDLTKLEIDDAEAQIRNCETKFPAEFSALLNAVYIAYYESPQVLQRISEKTGYNINPPQPDGYSLVAFDPELLQNVRVKKPFWKETHGNS